MFFNGASSFSLQEVSDGFEPTKHESESPVLVEDCVEGRFITGLVGLTKREVRIQLAEALGVVRFDKKGEFEGLTLADNFGEMPVGLTSGLMANILRVLRMNLLDGKNFHPKSEEELLGSFHDFMVSLFGEVEHFEVVDKSDLFKKVISGEATDRDLQLVASSYTVHDLHKLFYTRGGVEAKRLLIALLSEELVSGFVGEYTSGSFDRYGFYYPTLGKHNIYHGKKFHKEDDIYRFYLRNLVESVN